MKEILIIILASIFISFLIVLFIWLTRQRDVKNDGYNEYYKRFNNRNIKVTLLDIILQRNMKRLSK